MGEAWTVNSDPSLEGYIGQVRRWYNEYRYLTFPKPRIGIDRSIDQNSLFHVWLTEYAAHLTPCHTREVTEGMLDGIKRTMKGLFYRETQYEWMVHKVICPLSKREKIDYTSSASWLQGEMFLVLNFIQLHAAQNGCILESKGEHAKLTREAQK